MAITLFNPTNEEFTATYGGINQKIAPHPEDGHLLRVEDAKARHILNVFGPRGLTSLDYGDEGGVKIQKAEDGIARNVAFKRKQIIKYNQDNESRKMRQLEYVEPPDNIKEYAIETGLRLESPYEAADEKNIQIQQLRDDKSSLESQLSLMGEQMMRLTTAMEDRGLLDPDEDDAVSEAELNEIKAVYKMMNRVRFQPWVEELGPEGYSQYPVVVQEDIAEKWGAFFDPEELPFPY